MNEDDVLNLVYKINVTWQENIYDNDDDHQDNTNQYIIHERNKN